MCSACEVVRGSLLLIGLGETGYTYTLNMEEPVKIYDLAEYYCNKYQNKNQIIITQCLCQVIVGKLPFFFLCDMLPVSW